MTIKSAGEIKTIKPTDPGLWEKRPLLQKLLFFKIKGFDPDEFLEHFMPVARIFYSRFSVPVYAFLVFLAAVIFLSNRLELADRIAYHVSLECTNHGASFLVVRSREPTMYRKGGLFSTLSWRIISP